MIRINEQVEIDERELSFQYARSPGPGGQNVNKVETKVILRFAIDSSPSLDDEQKQRLHAALPTRITKDGILRVISHRFRTRGANQRAAVQRFAELLQQALAEQTPRRKTRVPAGARKYRLRQKRQRGQLKQQRSSPGSWDE